MGRDEIPSIDPADIPRIVAELHNQAQAQLDEKQVKAMVDINTKAFDRSTAYANAILVAGYAGVFTIWSFTRSQIPAKAGVAIALSLQVSLTCFVLFEVVKMVATSKIAFKNAGILQGDAGAAEKLEAMKILEGAHASTMMAFRWYWMGTMIVAVVGALIALALLTWNFVTVLVG